MAKKIGVDGVETGEKGKERESEHHSTAVDRLDVIREENAVRSSREADLWEAEQVRRLMKSERAARVEAQLRNAAYDASWLFRDQGEMVAKGPRADGAE